MKSLLICFFISSFIIYSESKIYFQETFENIDKWVQSEHKGKEFGAFKLTAGKHYGDEKINQGIQTSQDARFYGLSAKFDSFSNKDKTLVVQFSVKHEQDIDCGGGYIKVFNADLDQKDMHGETPYFVMFGPDICGPSTKRVHAILNYKGENRLIKEDIRCKDDILTHVYTLILNPDNTFKILIDNEVVKEGSIEEAWDVLPPKKIKDPEAKKPEDWDDRRTIADPDDTKPEDWDKPEHIPDPDATKPEDWDDEMDGEWEPPMIENPEYKGEWKPKQIDNPDFKGEWIHPEIDNPEYSPDPELYSFDGISAVGFDLWQVKSGSIFDNVIITDSVEEAEQFFKDTHEKTKEGEKKMKEDEEEIERKKSEEAAGDAGIKDDEDEDDEDLDDLETPEDLPTHEEL